MAHISEELRKIKIEAGRKGGRNKKGKRSKLVLTREEALKAFHNGVIKSTTGLLNVQRMLAFGSIKVFRIDSHWEDSSNGKTKYKVKSKPILVSDEDEIIAALDYEFGSGESPNDDSTYYFVTTKDPDQRAIDSLLDRTFGRPKESLELIAPIEVDPKDRDKTNQALERFLHGHRKNTKK